MSPHMSRVCNVLHWTGRTISGAFTALAAYIVVDPAVTGIYGAGAGVFTAGFLGFSLWFLSRTAIFLIKG